MKTKVKKYFGILGIAASIFLAACEYEFIQPPVVVVPDVVKFSTDIIPIFDKSCNMSGCHSSGHWKVDLTAANAYTDLNAKGLIDLTTPDQSKLYLKLTDAAGSHAGRSTAADQKLILKWIEDGAKNN